MLDRYGQKRSPMMGLADALKWAGANYLPYKQQQQQAERQARLDTQQAERQARLDAQRADDIEWSQFVQAGELERQLASDARSKRKDAYAVKMQSAKDRRSRLADSLKQANIDRAFKEMVRQFNESQKGQGTDVDKNQGRGLTTGQMINELQQAYDRSVKQNQAALIGRASDYEDSQGYEGFKDLPGFQVAAHEGAQPTEGSSWYNPMTWGDKPTTDSTLLKLLEQYEQLGTPQHKQAWMGSRDSIGTYAPELFEQIPEQKNPATGMSTEKLLEIVYGKQ